jgi:hypothetical protein
VPKQRLAPPPAGPLFLAGATPLQLALLDFQDAVAANTQPATIWETYGLVCHYATLLQPELLLRSSIEVAMAWAFDQGETGVALVRFGWACLRERLRENGLMPSRIIGHADWSPGDCEEAEAGGWLRACHSIQYVGTLVPLAQITLPAGGAVEPVALDDPPELSP